MKARDIKIGATVVVPAGQVRTVEGNPECLPKFRCTVLIKHDFSFVGDLSQSGLSKRTRHMLNDKIVVAYRDVDAAPELVRGKTGIGAFTGSLVLEPKRDARRGPITEARKKRILLSRADEKNARHKEFAAVLKKRYAEGYGFKDVIAMEHVSYKFLTQVEQEYNIERPEIFKARILHPNGRIDYVQSATSLIGHDGYTRNLVQAGKGPNGETIQRGKWIENKNGYHKVRS